MELGLILSFVPRSGLGLTLMGLLFDALLFHVNGLVMVIKPLLVFERGIATLDLAPVGGLSGVDVLMVSQVDFL